MLKPHLYGSLAHYIENMSDKITKVGSIKF